MEDEEQGAPATQGDHNRQLALWGEEAAARYLEAVGYQILDRNWRCPAGEADIVAKDDGDVVFVEVKTRTSLNKGFPEEAITPEKRRRYERIAAYYFLSSSEVNVGIRFDVIGMLKMGEDRALIKHHVNAFGVA